MAELHPTRLELGERPFRRSRREGVGGVLEQRLGIERGEDFLRVLLPVRGDVHVSAGGEPHGELVHERRRQEPSLVMALLGPGIGKEDVHAGKRCRRDHGGHDLDGVVAHHAHVREAAVGDPFEKAAHAGARARRRARKSTSGRRLASPPSSRPCRTRRRARATRGGRRRDRSRASRPRRGRRTRATAIRARAPARGDMRPCRSTKLRIGRRREVSSGGGSARAIRMETRRAPAHQGADGRAQSASATRRDKRATRLAAPAAR